jgi:MerR family copper efflux transcriptional regulator
MSRPLPIACTLSATDLAERGEELRALGGDGLVSVSEEPGRAVLRFRADADIHRRVEAIVGAESECCPFLDFRLEHDSDAIVLTITAPNGGAEVVRDLAAALGA